MSSYRLNARRGEGPRVRVSLPLIRSNRPGSLHSLSSAEIDDLPADVVCLPDVNVWAAAVADRHEDRATARQWFDSASAPICVCRVTQMAFLRLLTNPKVMNEDMLSPLPMNVSASNRNLRISRAPGFLG